MFMALADCSESPLFPLFSTTWNFKGTFMIKRRVERRSESNISILRTQGGTGLSLGRAQASFTNVASQGQVISIVGKSGPERQNWPMQVEHLGRSGVGAGDQHDVSP